MTTTVSTSPMVIYIDESPVEVHFTSEGHTEAELLVIIINRCWKKDPIPRKIVNSRWIRTPRPPDRWEWIKEPTASGLPALLAFPA